MKHATPAHVSAVAKYYWLCIPHATIMDMELTGEWLVNTFSVSQLLRDLGLSFELHYFPLAALVGVAKYIEEFRAFPVQPLSCAADWMDGQYTYQPLAMDFRAFDVKSISMPHLDAGMVLLAIQDAGYAQVRDLLSDFEQMSADPSWCIIDLVLVY